ncbi:NAD(P)H-dependent oxidoreductase [Eikenella sp. S3360]|uniref:FMN dependent NADH:quinone oxidoreductase n=1 Tax=Eikenella glucosivorans TaxID=2766967 RepID=A0ABS0N9H1_9NEIS|nr:NAD(P)H-dependent oxidoreductase [Eikenella glucosivorans]MBH5328949.1 NAD(P)H-dependent oxidoreductase [Eikenella glucosivorans]
MKILQILSHPDFANPKRAANRLAAAGEAALAQFGNAQIDTVNLYDPALPLPRINADTLNIRDPEQMPAAQKADLAAQKALLKQWKEADCIFIYSPIHNFNIPSKLKDYFDNILIVGETFGFTEQGYVGLMSDKTKVTAVLTSGSDFSTDFRYQAIDVAPLFLRAALHTVGIHNMTLIRAQGLDIIGNDKQALIDRAQAELEAHIAVLMRGRTAA